MPPHAASTAPSESAGAVAIVQYVSGWIGILENSWVRLALLGPNKGILT
jgi:hypothetical protein